MAKRLVSIGPWKRGLNLRATSDLIRDDELSQALNVVIRSDGTVAPRPGFQYYTAEDLGLAALTSTERLDVLGIINDNTFLVGKSVWDGTDNRWETTNIYKGVIASDPTSQTITWSNTGYTMHASSPHIVKAIGYINDVYFIPSNDVTGTTMLFAVGQSTALNFSSVSATTIPQGLYYTPTVAASVNDFPAVGKMTSTDLAFVWKDRLFICYKDRIYYSQATNFTVWDTSPGLGGFFDVGTDATNDLNYITGVVLSGDALYIFKPQGTYGFTFQTDPGTDGYLRVISDTQGATSVTEWRNRIFTTDQKSVYEYVSGQFIDIANQLDLSNNNGGYNAMTASGGVIQGINVLSDFLVVGPLIASKTIQFSGRYYAMNLNTGAWSKWDATNGVFHIKDPGETDTLLVGGFVGHMRGPQNSYYYLGGSETGRRLVFMNFNEEARKIIDGAITTLANQRMPRYYLETKQFTFGNDVAFKKIYRIQVNRNFGINEDNPTASIDDTNRRGGFGAYYTTPVDKAADLDQRTKVQSLFMDHYGNVRVGSTFRCTSFSLFFEFYYYLPTTMNMTANQKFYFRIDGFNVYVDQRADFANMQSLASS